SRCRR
ncbi:chlamydia polymorphic membrane middle domain protein, partial [Chlamydia psittaci 04DC42]